MTYKRGLTCEMKALEADGDQITAVVRGTADCDVLIEMDRGKVLDVECTCPCALTMVTSSARRP